MASIPRKLKPFLTPNFALFEDEPEPQEGKSDPVIPLHKLPRETLVEMCDDFKASVLAKHDVRKFKSSI